MRAGSALTGGQCLELFDAQLASRHLDLAARWLRAQGAGFYTIGSSGHEGNAAVAAALRPGDPALLHYRSGAFYLVRAAQAMPPRDGVGDVLLGLAAAAEEPIAGGRHKVLGHADLDMIPATSTIASHLPRALGLAFSLDRAARLGAAWRWPADAIVLASLGDASVNHSTAVGALNTAAYCAYQRLPLPLLIVCEDNGIGISVRTPPGWVAAAASAGRASATSTPTAPTSPTCSTPPSPPRSGSGSGAPPRSCTCRWYALAGTRAPTRRPPTASPARSRPAWRVTR